MGGGWIRRGFKELYSENHLKCTLTKPRILLQSWAPSTGPLFADSLLLTCYYRVVSLWDFVLPSRCLSNQASKQVQKTTFAALARCKQYLLSWVSEVKQMQHSGIQDLPHNVVMSSSWVVNPELLLSIFFHIPKMWGRTDRTNFIFCPLRFLPRQKNCCKKKFFARL